MRLFVLNVFVSVALCGGVIHWKGNYERARSAAIDAQKGLLVMVVKPKCDVCGNYIVELSSEPVIVEAIEKKYVAVIVTYDRWRNYPNELYFTTQFPSLFVVEPITESFVTYPIYGAGNENLSKTKRALTQYGDRRK